MGQPEDMLAANRLVLAGLQGRVDGEVDAASRLEGPVVVEPGARVVGSLVRRLAILGAGSLVVASYVGPFTSVGPGAVVRRSEVENRVLTEDAVVSHVAARVDGSIVGRGAVVEGRRGIPRAVRVVLGDSYCASLA